MRDDRRRREHSGSQVEFVAYESEKDLKNDNGALKFHMHVNSLILKNKINKEANHDEPDWYEFTVVVGCKEYHIDERTFRRLLSCQSHR